MGHVPAGRLHEDGKILRCDWFGDVRCPDATVAFARTEVLPAAGDTVRDGCHVGHTAGVLSAQSSPAGWAG